MQTLDIFIRSYGSVAGNLALTTLPDAGVYIAGGIAKIIIGNAGWTFHGSFFRQSQNLIVEIYVYIILNTLVGLIGAFILCDL